jgi:hypothetical protein
MGFLPSELLVRVSDKGLGKTKEKLSGWGKLRPEGTKIEIPKYYSIKHHVYIGRYRGVWEDEPLHNRRS